MSALALQSATDTLRSNRTTPQPLAILAQRKSSLGGPSAVTSPPIVDAGRPLDAGTRSSMESGFGQDFSSIRVHDDARAHDNARDMGARAYAAGDHIVFGEGQYRPETAMGQALIAHELAHSVQQGGVQMKADGPLPAASDSELEGQADRAAAAVTAGRAAPALSRIGTAAVFRNTIDAAPPAAGPVVPPAVGPAQKLPPGMTAKTDDPPGIGSQELIVEVDSFVLPAEKGSGEWVKKAHAEASAGGRLVFSPLIEGGRVAAYKEGAEDYKSIWLGNFGFSTTTAMSKAIKDAAKTDNTVKAAMTDKAVAKVVKGLGTGLQAAGCDIDHIVEKQMGGTSIPSNLQLLDSKKNQESGRETYKKLVGLVDQIRDPNMRGTKVKRLQLHLKVATVPNGSSDGSVVIEDLLRKGLIAGKESVKKAAKGTPVGLSAGGVGETVEVKEKGETKIEEAAKRIVPGMRLTDYSRGPQGADSKTDNVKGELDSRAISKTNANDKDSKVKLTATLQPAGTVPIGAAAGGEAATENAAATEQRKLAIPGGPQKIKFYYPYLSPGYLTSAGLDDKGNLIGSGVIEPSVKFLPKLEIDYGPDRLDLKAPINHDKINNSALMQKMKGGFRFTGGFLSIDLIRFKPHGELSFTMGPAAKPILIGQVSADVESGAFVARGKLKPSGKIPGIEEAQGDVTYHSDRGWSGALKVTGTPIPNAKVDTELGFNEQGGAIKFHAKGGIELTVKNKTFKMGAHWSGGRIAYSGRFRWEKPFKIVDYIDAEGYFSDEFLKIEGKGKFTFRDTWKGEIAVTYQRSASGHEKFLGDGNVQVETKDKKGKGSLEAHIDEKGKIWGKGKIAYQITPTIRPELEVELDNENHLHISGSLTLGPYQLFDRFPKDGKDTRELFKVATPKFTIPTPILGVTVYARLKANVGYGFYIGPGIVETIKITGKFDPLEENPNIEANLSGKFACPFGASAFGTVGAYVGAEVLGGLGSLEGGIAVTALVGLETKAKAEAFGKYAKGNFTVGLKPSFDMSIDAKLTIKGEVTASAAWGLFSHTWDLDIASFTKNLYKKTVDFGEISATFGSGKPIPGAQEKTALPDIDPMDMVLEIIGKKKQKETPNPNYDPNAKAPAGYDRGRNQ